jgi:hypothetical protein
MYVGDLREQHQLWLHAEQCPVAPLAPDMSRRTIMVGAPSLA